MPVMSKADIIRRVREIQVYFGATYVDGAFVRSS
jgi:hypothetical protein